MDQPTKHPIDRFIPWLFVLGFLVVFGANAIMITYALGSFPGFTENYHRLPAPDVEGGR